MALIDIGSDNWLGEYECCEKLYIKLVHELSERDLLSKETNDYNLLSGKIRIHLKQFSTELEDLLSHLNSTFTLTYEEKERRQRLVEDLQSKKGHLSRMYRSSSLGPSKDAGAVDNWYSASSSEDVPLLGQETSIEALKTQQKSILAEQDEGLERLSSVISRQKNIAITIGNEVGSQNELIDDIGTRVESVNTRIHNETGSIHGLIETKSTYGYWIVIILLLMVIIAVALK